MSKTKEISVTVKLSKDYNSYEASEVITIEDTDNVEKVRSEAFSRCKLACISQMPIPKEVKQYAEAISKEELEKEIYSERQNEARQEMKSGLEL